MKIREATENDAAAIRSIVIESLAEFGFVVEASGIDADLAEVPTSYQRRGGCFRVLVDDDAVVVGCGGLYPVDDQIVELRKMYFRPAARGRGFGRALLQELVDEAKAMNAKRIVLETASHLTAAIALYQGFGFRQESLKRHSCRCDLTFGLDLG
jgi:putative acetyltransferase